MNTNSILEIKLVCFKLEVVWVILLFYFLLILDKFSKSLIILEKEFHFLVPSPPKKYELFLKKNNNSVTSIDREINMFLYFSLI